MNFIVLDSIKDIHVIETFFLTSQIHVHLHMTKFKNNFLEIYILNYICKIITF